MNFGENSETTGADFGQELIRIREHLVLGKPPRIPPLAPDELSAEALEVAAKIAGAAGAKSAQSASDIPEIMATLMRHPGLTAKIMDLSVHLYAHGTLTPRDRELLALRTEWLCRTPFEWGEHVAIAKAVGVSGAEIERVTQGSSAPGWSEHDRALLRAVEELHATAMISDEVWGVLSTKLDYAQLFEVTVVVGHYTLAAYFENSLRLRLRAGNAGLKAR
jgi:alkylhydroperoxidase family enzyme